MTLLLSAQTLEFVEHVRTSAGEAYFHEPIGAPIFYHGSAKYFKPGDLIIPGGKVPKGSFAGSGAYSESSKEHVYLTRDPGLAAQYAGMRDDPQPESTKDDRYSVYQVEPTGPFELDPKHAKNRADPELYDEEPNYLNIHDCHFS